MIDAPRDESLTEKPSSSRVILRLDNVAPFHAILQWDSAGPSLLSSNRTALPRPFLSSDGIARPDRTTLPRSALFSDGTGRARPLLSSDRIARPVPCYPPMG